MSRVFVWIEPERGLSGTTCNEHNNRRVYSNRHPSGNHYVIPLSEFEMLKVFVRNNWDKELRDLFKHTILVHFMP